MTGKETDKRRAAELSKELAALSGTNPLGLREPGSPLEPGTELGPYAILSELGRGGMGVVYKARDEQGRELALKTILASRLEQEADGAKIRQRFLREARIALRLDHPRVVRSLDAGEIEGTLFLTCALLSGLSLRDILNRRRCLTEAEALSVLLDSLAGLAELHRLGLVHRDLKPDNLLLGDDGGLVISDLGLACSTEAGATRLTRTGEVFGSPAYMAPELIEGGRVVDIRCDLYALGIVLYECLCGEPPFRGRSPTVIWRRHIAEPPPDPRDHGAEVSEATVRLINHLLAKEPEQRPPGPEPLIAALARPAAGVPPARPLTPPIAGPEATCATELMGPRSRLRLELERDNTSPHALYAFARTRLQVGRNATDYQGQDVCLRLEPAHAFKDQNRRISGRHFAIAVRDGEAWVEDLDSTHGTRLDGVPLEAREPVPLPALCELTIAGALRLKVAVQRRADAVAAVLIERLNNAPELAYALVVSRLSWPLPGPDGSDRSLILEADNGALAWRPNGTGADIRPLLPGDELRLDDDKLHVISARF